MLMALCPHRCSETFRALTRRSPQDRTAGPQRRGLSRQTFLVQSRPARTARLERSAGGGSGVLLQQHSIG